MGRRSRLEATQAQLRLTVGTNVRRARLLIGATQEQLSEASGVDRTYVGAIERGVANWTCDILASIATALRIQPHVLLMKPTDAASLLANSTLATADPARHARVRRR